MSETMLVIGIAHSEKKAAAADMIYKLLKQYYGHGNNGSISLAHHADGKPYLEGSNIYAGISHTKNYTVVALSDSGDVGVDAEYIDEVPYEILNMVMHPNELRRFFSCKKGTDRRTEFCRVWTAKEAYGKYTGEGLPDNCSEIDTADGEWSRNISGWIYENCYISVYHECGEKPHIVHFADGDMR